MLNFYKEEIIEDETVGIMHSVMLLNENRRMLFVKCSDGWEDTKEMCVEESMYHCRRLVEDGFKIL